jgi:circadian clock protein KaiC
MSFGTSHPPETISTGVPGLDQLVHGGLTPRRMYLLEGNPGTGKTTLALQFLLEGRNRGETTLYVTLSETVNELRRSPIRMAGRWTT